MKRRRFNALMIVSLILMLFSHGAWAWSFDRHNWLCNGGYESWERQSDWLYGHGIFKGRYFRESKWLYPVGWGSSWRDPIGSPVISLDLGIVRYTKYETQGLHSDGVTPRWLWASSHFELRMGVLTILLSWPIFYVASCKYRSLQKARRRRRGLCPNCAYDLRGSDHGICPECGCSSKA